MVGFDVIPVRISAEIVYGCVIGFNTHKENKNGKEKAIQQNF